MEIRFQCSNPECATTFPVDHAFANRELPCPSCGKPCSTVTDPSGEDELHSLQEALRETRDLSRRYTEEAEIAQGGMGRVLQCRDKTIGRPVAMKVMQPEFARVKAQRIRFLEEAQITGQLEHPNIVPIHELGQDETGNLYFTMKLVKGDSLEDLIWQNKTGQKHTSLAGFLTIFLKICDAVAFAHSRGVIHRDLKPANVLVGDFGEVAVMDWGLAKIMPASGAASDDVRAGHLDDTELPRSGFTLTPRAPTAHHPAPMVTTVRSVSRLSDTNHGTLQGTPVYMAPEQAQGMSNLVDVRTDVYSLGCILYQMLTFKRPIEGQQLDKILQNVADGNIVPPHERTPRRNIPHDLSNLCVKAMSRERELRFQTVKEFGRAIQSFLDQKSREENPGPDLPATSPSVSPWNRLTIGVLSLTLVLLGLALLAALRLRGQRNDAREQLAAHTESLATHTAALQSAAEQLARLAVLAESEGNQPAAIVHADAAVRLDPAGPWGYYAWAQLWQTRGDREQAAAFLEKALRADPDHAPSLALKEKLGAPPGN